MPFEFQTPEDCYRFATVLIGIYALIDSLEQLAFWKARRPGGALCWQFPDETAHLNRFRRLEWIFDHPATNVGLVVRAVAGGIAIGLAISGGASVAIFIWLIFLTQIQNNVLHRFRLYPAMHRTMGLIVLAGVALPAVVSSSGVAQQAGVWFLALQVAIAYFFSGVRKLEQREWRDGSALFHSLVKGGYRNLTFVNLVGENPFRWRVLAWSVIVFELGFPLALIFPNSFTDVILGAGIVFHLSIHALMGLTHFLWTFVASYGAVLYINKLMPWN